MPSHPHFLAQAWVLSLRRQVCLDNNGTEEEEDEPQVLVWPPWHRSRTVTSGGSLYVSHALRRGAVSIAARIPALGMWPFPSQVFMSAWEW